MAAQGAMKDVDVDRLVAEWLKKRNFTESLKVLKLELQATMQPESAAEAAELQRWTNEEEGGSLLEGVLLGTAGGGDPASYALEFAQLEAWVDGSLDLYRPELCRLLYPVFVHSYLQLAALGAASEAHALLADHKQRFLDAVRGARSGRVRERELHELLSLSTPEQLASSGLVRALRAARTPARLTQYAYDLLIRFLQNSRLLLMLGVMNQRLAIEVVEALAPAGGGAAEEEGGLTSGAAAEADADIINQAPLELKLLHDGAEQEYKKKAADSKEKEAAALAEDESAKITKKQRAALQREAAVAKTERETVGDAFMAPQIPLAAVPKERQEALLEEMKAREVAGAGKKPVSSDALPSAAFFTFVNTQQSLNCVALSADAARVAAGFADSSLRVFALKADASARMTANGTAGSQSDAAGGSTYFWGHSGPVYAAAFSPDEQLLLSSGADGSVRLWSMEMKVGLAAYKGHMLPVWDAAFAPYFGFYFASGGADRTARVWNTERSQALRVFVGHQGDVDVVRWHPNCHYLATGSNDRTIRLWDLRSGGCVRVLSGSTAPITSLEFSPDGNTLASGDEDGTVSAWDLASAGRLAACEGHSGAVWSLAYSNGDGNVLVSGGADCTARLWAAKDAGPSAAGDVGRGGAGAAAATAEPTYRSLATWCTKATPVVALRFTTRNLLLGAGPLSLHRPRKVYL